MRLLGRDALGGVMADANFARHEDHGSQVNLVDIDGVVASSRDDIAMRPAALDCVTVANLMVGILCISADSLASRRR